MPEHPDTLIWVAGVKPALVVKRNDNSMFLRKEGRNSGFLLYEE